MKLFSLSGFVFFILYGTIIDQVLNQLDIPYSSYITQGVSKLAGSSPYVSQGIQLAMTVAIILVAAVAVRATPRMF